MTARVPGAARAARAAARGAQAAVWLPVAHLGALAALGSLRPAVVPVASGAPSARIVAVVPGRNEEAVIGEAVRSLLAVDYPADLLRVLVLADNCTDATAAVARALGAEAWERDDPAQASKGAALAWAFGRLADDPGWDAVLVLDADGTVAPDLLRVLDARLRTAAVIQCERRVSNVVPTLLTRLSEVSTDAQTVLRPRARQRAGAAAKLFGTGMVFRRDVLARVPWQASGLVEDVEYWLDLLAAGVHPVFESHARVADLMPTDVAAARRQRARWENGRAGLVRQRAWPALREALRAGDVVRVEAVVGEVLMPTLSVTAASVVATTMLSLALRRTGVRTGAAQTLVVAAHVAAGLRAAGAPAATWRALAVAPVVVAWKTGLTVRTKLTRSRTSTPWQGTRSGG